MRLSYLLTALTTGVPSLANFTWSGNDFLLDGEKFQILGGQIDPARVPYELWDERLAFLRAAGLNTVFSYIYWDQLEPVQGQHNTEGANNIAAWIEKAEAADLKVVLRVGPYICGEHEYGGFPYWLANIDGITIRANNQPFLDAVADYLNWFGSYVEPYFASNGGPVILAQIENEYGFYGSDHDYTNALAELFKTAFPGLEFYTNDGSGDAIRSGSIPGILAETDGGLDGFDNRDDYIDPSSKGPYLDGEYYITWIDHWGPTQEHQAKSGKADQLQNIQNDFNTLLDTGNSVSLYMFHGGTNWGFQVGANADDVTEAITTSYDYGAPLDESGRPNDIYDLIRSTITAKISGTPDVPSKGSVSSTDPINLTPSASLFDTLPDPSTVDSPQTFEQLGQQSGFILYRWTATSAASGDLTLGDGPRDRILVYVNNERVGLIDSRVTDRPAVNLNLNEGDVLDLLVENYGRVNFGGSIPDQRKGIVGDVKVGDAVITPIDQYQLPLDTPLTSDSTAPPTGLGTTSPPAWYTGTFDISPVDDTFLSLPGWTRGIVYVNGHNLGRYWIVGPQQQLYVPGVWLKETGNQISVLNLEITGDEGPVQGVDTRTWGNNKDPDGGDAP